jgi:putative transposase
MPHRVSPTERIRGHIDELFASGRQLPEILEEVARLGAQLLMQAALEAEITEFLGRDRYQRAAACQDARPGSRNGYREVTVKTTAGPVQLARPKLRGTTEAFASRLFGSHVTKTNALESLVIASFVRGLSVRDVEAALAEALGDQAAISKSTVSSVCGQITDEYEAWARRRLDGSRWITCSWMPPSSGCTPAPRPSRSWPRGASPPAASPRSSAWLPAPGSPPTPGVTSCKT